MEWLGSVRAHLLLLSAVAVLLGLLLFIVYWLDHPFGNQLGVTSAPFEQSLSVFDQSTVGHEQALSRSASAVEAAGRSRSIHAGREGCPKSVCPDSKHPHCSFICLVLDNGLSQDSAGLRSRRPKARSAPSCDLTVVELSDAWTKYQQLHSRLFQVAANAGITDEHGAESNAATARPRCYSSLTAVASTARNPHSDLRSGCH